MLKYLAVVLFIGIVFVHAETVNNIDNLKAEKQVLLLKLESYQLKKKIIEIQNFIENNRLQKEKRIKRELALIRLKNDLRRNQNLGF